MHDDAPVSTRGYRVCLLLVVAFAFCCGFFHLSATDIGFHMRTGAEVLATRSIPSSNTFSYTHPDHPWLLMQWWPATLFYLVYQAADLAGVVVLKAAIATAILLMVWLCAREESGARSWWPFWIMIGAALIARHRFFLRPFMVSGLLFAVMIYCDLRFQRHRKWQWIGMPLFMAFWANTHVGMLYGIVYLAARAGGEGLLFLIQWWKRRPAPDLPRDAVDALIVRPAGLVMALLASALALQLINPSGAAVLLVPITQFLDPFFQEIIIEYQPTSWSDSPPFYVSLAVLAVLQGIAWRSFSLPRVVTVLPFVYLAISAQRCLLVYAIAAAPYAARLVARASAGWKLDRVHPVLIPVTCIALLLGVVVRDPAYTFGVGLHRPYYPMEIYGFMRDQVPPQHVFNRARYGGAMLWWLYPEFRPFIDVRGTAYPRAFWQQDYLPAIAGDPEWRDVFDRYDVTAALVAIRGGGEVKYIARALWDDPAWHLVAFNDHTLLFLQDTEANRGIVQRHAYTLVWPGNWAVGGFPGDQIGTVLAEAERAFAFAPHSRYARTALARARLDTQAYAAAIELYEDLAAEPNAGDAVWRDYGFALLQDGRIDDADAAFDHMLERGWSPGFAWYMKHFVAAGRRDLDTAAHFLNRAIAEEPENKEYREKQKALNAIRN